MEAVNGGMLGEDKGGPPPPSPLTGCYLLVVVGEPHSGEHKDIILQRVAKGLLSWDVNSCLVDLEKELSIITDQGLEGEEARYGERLIQFASENLVTEILIHPAVSTLSQCVRNLLSSFTRHRHVIHAGYTFQGNGSWAVQDGTFSYSDFSEAFQEIEVQRSIHAYENGISLDLHCSPEGDWTRLPKETFTKACKVRVNPTDVLTTGSSSISNFIKYLAPFLVPTSLENILESSDVVGNIRFSRPTLYVFPGGQGDAALFGINGFNMLLDGGYSRKACFWDFVRHLDRLDAVLMTRLNNSSICGISSVLKRKKQGAVYPQVGHFFCNIQERKSILSPDGDKDKDPLIFSILEEGQSIVQDLQYLNLNPQSCYRDQEPIILYHKVGHGTLNMYVLSPDKNSREVRDFLQKWNQSDPKMFAGTRGGRDFSFPLQNLVSICALLIWQPANPNDTITRILYPGSTPQKKIFEGFDRLKNLECIKHPLCSEKSLAPVKKSKQEVLDKLTSKDRVMSEKRPENKLIEEAMKNGEMNGDVVREKQVKKSDSLESDKEKKTKKVEEKKLEESKKADKIEDVEKIIENGEKIKAKPKSGDAKPFKKRGDSQHRKKPTLEKKGPTTPKKTVENKTNGETKDKEKDKKGPQKSSPSATPAKSTKDANNRRVIENKKTLPKKEPASKPAPPIEAKTKPERKPISRRPKTIKGPPSPMKKMTNGVQKPDSISKRGKLDKEGTTDSSTVSTPSADQDSVLKKDISKLTPEEIQQLKDKELDELKEEQEAVKEIEAVFKKGEGHVEEAENGIRKIKDISIDDNLDTEEYLIIEKEEIEHDSLDQETKEDEMQKLARDSEESEKQRKLSSEEKEINIQIEAMKDLPSQEIFSKEDVPAKTIEDTESKKPQISSPEDKGTPTTDKKELADEEVKEIVESHPEEKVSANVESGATTTAPTLPEDERITLDDIKEDNNQPIEEKHVKEETKEKEVPVIQLPPQSQQDSQAKMPLNVGIALDKQKHIRDIVKTPDEVADLPVHEEADFHEFHGDGKKNNESDIGNEQAKEDKKIEEKKDDKESVDEFKEEAGEKEKDVGEIQTDHQLQKEVPSDIKNVEKGEELVKKINDLKEVAEKEIKQLEPEKEITEELFVVKEIAKDIAKDVKSESEIFLDQEKAADDSIKQEHVEASTTPIIVEKAIEITESIEKADETQKFEILEKAELETKEKMESKTVLHENKLKESIDDEWVVITKEEEDHNVDKVETAQEAEKAMEDKKEDLKEALTDIKTSKSDDEHKQDLKNEVIDKHEQSKPNEKALSEETNDEEKKISEEKVVPKEDVLTELPITPKAPNEDTDAKEKEEREESEGECDDHDIRKEDEIQEILEKDKEDIKALIEEADTKILSDDQKLLDETKNVIESPEVTEEKITHLKETGQEVVGINEKIQELKKDIHEPVEEISFSRTKRDLTKIDEPVHTDLKEDVEKLTKIDDKLQELKHDLKHEERPIEKAEIKIEKSTKSPQHAEQVTLPDSSPDESEHLTFGDFEIDKIELGRKSPAEREEDVKKIVVSVAEVLKSEAPLEIFQGKLPFTQELRETHITTQDSPIIDAKVIISDDIPTIPEEPAELKEESTDIIDRRKDLIAGAQELIAASSKVISDIKSKSEEKVDKLEEELEKTDDKLKDKDDKDVHGKEKNPEEETDNNEEKDDASGTVHRMLVTASSEDGGEEIEICPVGTIIFSKSSESSGRSSPEPSQKTQSQKSSIVETLSDTLSTVKQITEKEGVEDISLEKHSLLDSLKDSSDYAKEKIEDINRDIHKTETEVEKDVSDIIKSAEILAQDSQDEIKGKAKSVENEIKQAQDDVNDVISDIKQEVNEASKKVDDKSIEVSSKVEELSEKAESISAKAEIIEKEEIKVTEDLATLQQDISKDVDKTLSESKDIKESTTDKMDEIVGKTKEIADETNKDMKEKVDEGILEAKSMVTSAANDAVLKTDDVKTQLVENITTDIDKVKEVVKSKDILTDISDSTKDAKESIQNKTEDTSEEIKGGIKEVKDETLEKPQEILTDISSSIAGIQESIENKNGESLQIIEDTADLIKKEIKEVKDEIVDKSKEMVADISSTSADVKESIENKTGDALKIAEETRDSIKEEIKAEKDETVDQYKEIVAEVSSSIADTKQTVENKADDILKTTEEIKDKIKEATGETVDKSKEILTDISSSIADLKNTIENKTGDAVKIAEEAKDLIKEEIKEIQDETVGKPKEILEKKADDTLKMTEEIKDKIKEATDETVDKSKEMLTDISGSIADTMKTIEKDLSDPLKDSKKAENLKKELTDKSRDLLPEISGSAAEAKETTEVKKETIDKPKEILGDVSESIMNAKEIIESKVSDTLKTSDEVTDATKEDVKSVKESKVDKLIGETEKLTKKPEADLSQAKHDATEAAVAASEDLKEKSDSTSAKIENFVEKTEEHILKETQKIEAQGSEDLKQVTDKIDKAVVSAKGDVANEVEAMTSKVVATVDKGKDNAKTVDETVEEKLYEVKDNILAKAESVVTESSQIDDKIKDELTNIGSKIEDSKEKIFGKVDEAHQKVKDVVDDKVKVAEAEISHLKDAIKEQSQEGMDKSKEIADNITEKFEEDLEKLKDVVVETRKDVTEKIGDLSESVLDVTKKIEETIGIKADDIDNAEKLSSMDSDKKLAEKVEDKLVEEETAIITDDRSLADIKTKESTPERRGSVIEKAEELLEKSEQAISSVFSVIGDAAKSVLQEILPDDKKDEFLGSSSAISRKSTPDLPQKESGKEDEKTGDSGDISPEKHEGDTSALVTEVVKITKDILDSKVKDIKETIKEKEDKIINEVKELTNKTEHAVDVAEESLKCESAKISEKVVEVEKASETAAELKGTTSKKTESVVGKAEELLDKAEKTIESTVTAIGDAVASVFNDILPDPKSSASEIKMKEDHIKKDTIDKLEVIEDSTEQSAKSDTNVPLKRTSLETSPAISGKSTPDLLTDKTGKESEKLYEKSDTLQYELEAIKSGVLRPEDQKVEASDQIIQKPDARDGDEISHVELVEHREHGIIKAAEEFIEESEKVVESVFSKIEEAAKSIIHDVSDGKEKGSEEKSHDQKEKADDKKESLQHEEKEIEDKSTPFDSSTSDKSKVDKEISEKKIEDQEEPVIFEKCKFSEEFKMDKEVSEKEEKQTKEQVSNLEHRLEDVEDRSKSISFDECHILKEDKLAQKQIDTLEKTFETVSDMTKSIVLEKDKDTFDATATEKKETTSSSDVVIDSNKLGEVQSSSLDKGEKEEFLHEEQEKKDPEKEHVKLEDKVEEKLEIVKQDQKQFEENIKDKQEPTKQDYKKVEQHMEVLKDSLECDITKSVYIEKSDSSPESHKLDDNISDTSKPKKSGDILKTDDTSLKAKDSIVLEDQHISSQTEKCEKESMEKTLNEKDSTSLKVERTETKKLSISDVEISIKTEECPKDASKSFLDNERALLRDNIDAKVYVCPVSSQDDDKASADEASSSSIIQAAAEAPTLSDKSSPDLELSGRTTPPTVPVSPIAKEVKSPSLKLDSGLSEQTETDDEDLSTKSQVAHSQSDLDELDMKMDPMSMSFYGALPGEGSEEVPATLLYEITKAKYTTELKQEDEKSEKKGEVDLMTASFIGELPSVSSDSRTTEPKEDVSKKDAVDSWGKPLGLPAPTYLYEVTKAKFSSSTEEPDLMTCSFIGETLQTSSSQNQTGAKTETDPMTTSVYFEHSSDSGYDPIASWGKPLGLPSPAPPNNEKGTPKKERKLPAYVTAKNKLNDDKKRADSPSKLKAKKINPVYMDLTYVPHHGNHNYSYVDFFKKIRARYYVFSGLEPSRQVYDALLEAKQTWEDKELEVTIIPTYDTDILGYWVAENEELLSKFKIDLSPSASRCTINLQDHETSCSAYRLEF